MNEPGSSECGLSAPALAPEAGAPPVSRSPLTPSELENLIELYRLVGTHERDGEMRREAFTRMGELIAQRSLETVARMETAKGLR